jgi:hypothetical protein
VATLLLAGVLVAARPGPGNLLEDGLVEGLPLGELVFRVPSRLLLQATSHQKMSCQIGSCGKRERERKEWRARTSTLAGSTENLEVKVKVITKRAIGKIIARAIL